MGSEDKDAELDGFQQAKPIVRRKTSCDQYAKTLESLEKKLKLVEASPVFDELKKKITLAEVKASKIRCLSLGSITEEAPALFQFALLILLVELLEVRDVSLWDPAFNAVDRKILTDKGFKVKEDSDGLDETLYYMPHVPINVLEMVIESQKPRLMLTNNISVYGDKWTESQLYEKYRYIALLDNACGKDARATSVTTHEENGFEVAISKRKRKQNKKFVTAKVKYDYTGCYFKQCKAVGFETSKDLSQIYGSAFSDMALYIVQ